jgi:N-dimethylarginine dimethylaminohydrolase
MINKHVLMSGVEFFRVEELNPYSHTDNQPDSEKTSTEYLTLIDAFTQAGITVERAPSPTDCQDGVYTANWALCRGNKAVMARLPNMREAETPYAEAALRALGKEIIYVPDGIKFSGQGDALPIGNFLLAGQTYRTDKAAHQFIAETLGYEVVSLQTVPALNADGQPITNKVTGWPDSFFYDIDLAISVLTPELIAWCPEAFTPESQTRVRELPLDKIEVSLDEAQNHFACNLVSTGKTVVMSNSAPKLKAAIEAKGLTTITPDLTELPKGGGYIRCTTLTLDSN